MIVEEKTLSSEYVYKGRIINVRLDRIVSRSGEAYREIVEHNGGVVILGITNEGKIPMVRQYRKSFDKVLFELPAGKLEKGEDPNEAAVREFKEETGYSAEKFKKITEFLPTVGFCDEVLHLYFAENLTPGETNFDATEAIEIEEYTPDELYKMIDRNEIHDGKTLIGLLLYKNMKR